MSATWELPFVRAPYRLLDRVELRDPAGAPLSSLSGYALWLVQLFELPARRREWPPVMAPDGSERTT